MTFDRSTTPQAEDSLRSPYKLCCRAWQNYSICKIVTFKLGPLLAARNTNVTYFIIKLVSQWLMLKKNDIEKCSIYTSWREKKCEWPFFSA